jgi:hypothetical protein
MPKINGTLVLFKTDASGSSAALVHVDSATWNSSLSLAQATDKGSAGFMEYLEEAGLMEASIDANGNADFTAVGGNVKELQDALQARQNLAFVFGPEATGEVQFSGNCILNDNSYEAPNEETSTFSASFAVNGEWTIDTVS